MFTFGARLSADRVGGLSCCSFRPYISSSESFFASTWQRVLGKELASDSVSLFLELFSVRSSASEVPNIKDRPLDQWLRERRRSRRSGLQCNERRSEPAAQQG